MLPILLCSATGTDGARMRPPDSKMHMATASKEAFLPPSITHPLPSIPQRLPQPLRSRRPLRMAAGTEAMAASAVTSTLLPSFLPFAPLPLIPPLPHSAIEEASRFVLEAAAALLDNAQLIPHIVNPAVLDAFRLPDWWYPLSPDPHLSAPFLLSNIAYAMVALDFHLDPQVPKWLAAGALAMGSVSLTFHATQVALGPETGVVHLACVLDVVCAILLGSVLMAHLIQRAALRMSLPFLLMAGVALVLLIDVNGDTYTVAHSVWHFLSASCLFLLTKDSLSRTTKDSFPAYTPPQQQPDPTQEPDWGPLEPLRSFPPLQRLISYLNTDPDGDSDALTPIPIPTQQQEEREQSLLSGIVYFEYDERKWDERLKELQLLDSLARERRVRTAIEWVVKNAIFIASLKVDFGPPLVRLTQQQPETSAAEERQQ
ncbi:unnamed protein product [Vitrella brassicaformis CCMP3155]|uniref:Uncharacterized protein n=2 Tax=Vitrella brassicaformis TaxID=1169539 RepID=A0A0G4E8J3_VITBC|nr:unnamed protein product [Vitrella brassicaformis CCMP3155]|eukprot:CEL92104.1 unnamed protein product [Vitrella brassicaformis CCMP3155]